ncbi:MAG TPA: penicillin-binding transpeptidase domain-containing protein, partial [Polyangiaceae bacterium]
MIWARFRRLGSVPALAVAASLAAIPATSARAAEPRPAIDLDHMVTHGDHWVAPLATGGDAQLTLDPELQQAAVKILASANPVRGGMIVLDAHSGQVLVWAETARDGHHHQTLTTARVPAASVFKLVTTAALFETTTLSPHDEVCIS